MDIFRAGDQFTAAHPYISAAIAIVALILFIDCLIYCSNSRNGEKGKCFLIQKQLDKFWDFMDSF